MKKEKLTLEAIKSDLIKIANYQVGNKTEWRFSYIAPLTALAIFLGILTKNVLIGIAIFCVAAYHIVRYVLEYKEYKAKKAAILSLISRGEISVSTETFSHIANEVVYEPRKKHNTKTITLYHFDGGSSWRFSGHLAGVALYYDFLDAGCDLVAGQGTVTDKYLDNFKAVWDMYVNTSSADKATLESGIYNGETEFGMGEAVFYQNGNWEYAPLTNPDNGFEVTAEDLGMMPIYFGVDDANQGLCVGTENYWAVNAKASQEDIDATLAFLEWVITSDEGRDATTNKMGLSAPFDTFTGDFAPSNVFSQDNNAYAAAGKTAVAWSFNATPNVDTWRADIVTPLTAYTHGDGSWDDVVKAFVDGWATQWELAHAE